MEKEIAKKLTEILDIMIDIYNKTNTDGNKTIINNINELKRELNVEQNLKVSFSEAMEAYKEGKTIISKNPNYKGWTTYKINNLTHGSSALHVWDNNILNEDWYIKEE